jgi:membrane protease YdiL (CAAX protease family)
LLTSPLFEEPAWRGFALGSLQARLGREVGSLVVGLLWWLWHQPMNLTFGLEPTLYSAISMVALSLMGDFAGIACAESGCLGHKPSLHY